MFNERRTATLELNPAPVRRVVDGPMSHPRATKASSETVVLIASAQADLRRAWRLGVRAGVAVEVADHAQLVRHVTHRKPGVLLLDLELPQLGGLSGVAVLRRLEPSTKVVVLAARPLDREGVAALKLGALGYCDRAIPPSLLSRALEAVQSGEVWVGRKLTSYLLDELSALTDECAAAAAGAEPEDLGRRLECLTPRERDIIGELGAGASNKEIAQKFSVTERTVKAHLTAIFRKLGISGRLQAALFVAGRAAN